MCDSSLRTKGQQRVSRENKRVNLVRKGKLRIRDFRRRSTGIRTRRDVKSCDLNSHIILNGNVPHFVSPTLARVCFELHTPTTTISSFHHSSSQHMTNFLPLLNSTNRFAASATVVTPGSYGVESSKRKKCVALAAQKAAPTCTLSLTSVSVSAHGSSDALDFIPFPSSPANTTTSTSTGIPFPSTTTPILSSTKVTTACPPRPRLRSQSSLLRRRRSTARLVQPVCTADFLLPPCSSQVESEPDQLAASTPPRKRARKTSISTPSSSAPTVSAKPTSYHSLAISSSSAAQKKAKPSKKATADLRLRGVWFGMGL
ncbi:hypothetical protein NP233_g6895 [Leucocoprinus birnbaumii]|uniref:Uncharacterized protein n=1 Tax=Leucocoprinus birnbaumii TaxID=56174 RepID=A0AAD5VQC5_9AGAR|nr:hypothetical protein NP233_g6895 [Leucocoprinus birnbaumii]